MMGLSKWYLCGGEGFASSEEKAFIYAEQAAKAGLPQAEFAMGTFSKLPSANIQDISMKLEYTFLQISKQRRVGYILSKLVC